MTKKTPEERAEAISKKQLATLEKGKERLSHAAVGRAVMKLLTETGQISKAALLSELKRMATEPEEQMNDHTLSQYAIEQIELMTSPNK